MFLKKNFSKSSSYIVFTIFVVFFICFIHTYTFGKIFKIQDIEIEEPFNSNFNKEKVINKAFGEAFNILLNSLITSKDKNKIKNDNLIIHSIHDETKIIDGIYSPKGTGCRFKY